MQYLMVTGGAGFIGANFTLYMLEKYPQYQVVVYDKLTYAGNLDNLRSVQDNPRYHFVHGDICDADKVEQTIQKYDIDTIVTFQEDFQLKEIVTKRKIDKKLHKHKQDIENLKKLL